MISDLYHQQLLEEAEAPRNQTPLERIDATTQGSNASCGDTVQVDIQYEADGQTIQAIAWQGTGCIISTAGMSVLSELVKGKTKAEIAQLTPADILAELGLTNIAPGRVKCLTLGLYALQQVS